MRIWLTAKCERDFVTAPQKIQMAFDKQSKLLIQNLRHPSLRAKKYAEAADVWQARITGNWRFYFTIEGDTYHLTSIEKHRKR